MKTAIIILSSILILSGCNTTREILVSKDSPQIRIIDPAKPRPIHTKKVRITVFDREALEKALQDPNFRRIIGMTERDYANIANNYEEAIRFIEAQSAIIDYYENVIKELRERKIVEVEEQK